MRRMARLPKWSRTLLDALADGGTLREIVLDVRRWLAAFQGRPLRSIGRLA
jgi:hypothetical protein